MELDQDVVRSSFRHYGVQPQFDDSRVQWWFGDAVKSLQLLPKEMFGTFDLVVIDLETYIFENLRVVDNNTQDNLSFGNRIPLTNFMMQLLKPDAGILIRQEDFLWHNNVDFAKHTVDFNIAGLSYLCQQSYTMGSNGIDFSKQEPKNHPIEELVVLNKLNPSLLEVTKATNTTSSAIQASHPHQHTTFWTGYRTNKLVGLSQSQDTETTTHQDRSLNISTRTLVWVPFT